jgi:hypothetical protein
MIYLDNAATSWPKPETVYRAMDEFARQFAGNPGRSGHRMAVESEKRVQGCREAVARLLNAESPDRGAGALGGAWRRGGMASLHRNGWRVCRGCPPDMCRATPRSGLFSGGIVSFL